MTYRGDSEGKALGRDRIHQNEMKLLGDRFFTNDIVFLSSREAKDAFSLIKLNKNPTTIVAVEKNWNEYLLAEQILTDTGVKLYYGTVSAYTKAFSNIKPISGIYLDFCGPLCKDTIFSIQDVCENVSNEFILTITLLKAREKQNSFCQNRTQIVTDTIRAIDPRAMGPLFNDEYQSSSPMFTTQWIINPTKERGINDHHQ